MRQTGGLARKADRFAPDPKSRYKTPAASEGVNVRLQLDGPGSVGETSELSITFFLRGDF